uniref:Membrane associated ring finger 1 8 n=1 Tax=Rhizophora mucronata TaxID=61149 RepID=A0A2P2JYW7_RHIMU
MVHLVAYLTDGVTLLIAPPLYTVPVSILQAPTTRTWYLHICVFILFMANPTLHHFPWT